MKYFILPREIKADDNRFLPALLASQGPLAYVAMMGLKQAYADFNDNASFTLAVPKEWKCPAGPDAGLATIAYSDKVELPPDYPSGKTATSRLSLSNGRYIAHTDFKWLNEILQATEADIIGVNVDPGLSAFQEKIKLTAEGMIAGFRRRYADTAWLAPVPADWPHHLFIKTKILHRIAPDRTLPLQWAVLLKQFRESALTIKSLRIAGSLLDLTNADDLLSFFRQTISASSYNNPTPPALAEGARLFGKIISGNNVRIGREAVIVGPALLGDNVTVGSETVIRSAIVGDGLCLPAGSVWENDIVLDTNGERNKSLGRQQRYRKKYYRINGSLHPEHHDYRSWRWYSYGGIFKRLGDIVAALVMLVLFAPFIPILAAAIKISSKGPVFFKHRRQGRYGRDFNCLKFRTMISGADKIQDRLRVVNQVDGPQFKIEDDPRVSSVGRFLRDTCIDEIPQFINVLLGQMSLIGPRPSPEKENLFCAYWRDARLSVRPGITGLWQVSRTREAGQDFQEWVAYDTEYVRKLSAKLDLWICGKTAKHLITNFVRQF